jgi:hypothetical protein
VGTNGILECKFLPKNAHRTPAFLAPEHFVRFRRGGCTALWIECQRDCFHMPELIILYCYLQSVGPIPVLGLG